MRLTMRGCSSVVVALYLTACSEKAKTLTTPLVISTPRAGDVSDRCLVEVRTDKPIEGNSYSIHNDHIERQGHVNWRINGGATTEVVEVNDLDPVAPFLFGATLASGANHLEVGNCDEFDACGWTAVDVTVKTHSGSPDCALLGGGQPILPKQGAGLGVDVLTDGRTLVSTAPAGNMTGLAIFAFRADGTLDPRWGEKGIAALPNSAGHTPHLVPQADGSFFVILEGHAGGVYLAHLSSTGAFDASFGNQMGYKAYGAPAPGGASILATSLDAGGKLLVAGGAVMDATKFDLETPYVMELGFDGAPGKFTLVDDGGKNRQVFAAAVDATGGAAFLFEDRVVKGSLAGGLDKTFGPGGHAPAPNSSFLGQSSATGHAVLLIPGAVVVAQHLHEGPSDVAVRWFDARGVGRDLRIPFQSPLGASDPSTLLAAAPDGSVYVASTTAHPANVARSWHHDPQPGADFAAVRLRDGAIDTTFGRAGMATVGFAMAWPNAAIDGLTDSPVALAVDMTGHPWLAGTSRTVAAGASDSFTARGPGAAVTRLLP